MHEKIRQLELDFLHSLRNISNPFLDTLFEIITILGEESILIGILAIFYFIYDKKIGQIIAYTLFTSLLVNHTVKGLVKYERPFHFDSSLDAVRTETATGYSFPSGHTHQAATLYSSIAKNVEVSRKKLLWSCCIVIILLVGFSRLWLAVHYPKDVIVGLILGFMMTYLCSFLYEKFAKSYKNTLILYAISLGIFTPLLFVYFKNSYDEIYVFRNFYICYAMYAGFICAYILEEKYVKFSCNTTLKKKIIRTLGAAVAVLLIKIGLKEFLSLIFDKSIFLDMLRYFLMTFVCLGLYPFIFRKNLFKD